MKTLALTIANNATPAKQLLASIRTPEEAFDWLRQHAVVQMPEESPDNSRIHVGPGVPGVNGSAEIWVDTSTGCIGVHTSEGWVQTIGQGALVPWAPDTDPDHVRSNARLRKLTNDEVDSYGLKGEWGFITGLKRSGVIYK